MASSRTTGRIIRRFFTGKAQAFNKATSSKIRRQTATWIIKIVLGFKGVTTIHEAVITAVAGKRILI
jgi:hypothetical protein